MTVRWKKAALITAIGVVVAIVWAATSVRGFPLSTRTTQMLWKPGGFHERNRVLDIRIDSLRRAERALDSAAHLVPVDSLAATFRRIADARTDEEIREATREMICEQERLERLYSFDVAFRASGFLTDTLLSMSNPIGRGGDRAWGQIRTIDWECIKVDHRPPARVDPTGDPGGEARLDSRATGRLH